MSADSTVYAADLFKAVEEGSAFRVQDIVSKLNGNSRGVQKLLATVDDDQRTPFHWACSRNNLGIATYLISTGYCDINVQDEEVSRVDGITTLSGATPLHYAASKGHLEIAQALIEAGASVNDTDKYGNTPLMKSSAAGRKNIMSCLLDKGADALIAAKATGDTALHMAVNSQDIEACLLLVNHSNDLLWIGNKEGMLPLEGAASKEFRRTIEGSIQEQT